MKGAQQCDWLICDLSENTRSKKYDVMYRKKAGKKLEFYVLQSRDQLSRSTVIR